MWINFKWFGLTTANIYINNYKIIFETKQQKKINKYISESVYIFIYIFMKKMMMRWDEKTK